MLHARPYIHVKKQLIDSDSMKVNLDLTFRNTYKDSNQLASSVSIENIQFINTCMNKKETYKGNKQTLPKKPCKTCGRDMTWRKSWAKNWDNVLYCSDACRKFKSTSNTT